MTFFSASLTLRSVLELLPSPITELVVIQNLLFMACHKPIEKWFIVVVFLLDKMTLQVTIFFVFLIFGQLMRHSLIEPFHLSNLLQMLMTIEWSTLSSLSTSRVVVRGSALMMALS